jgi:hypothetical protein
VRSISYENVATFILKYYKFLNLPLKRVPGLSKNVNTRIRVLSSMSALLADNL